MARSAASGRSLDYRSTALRRANEVRIARSQLKKQLQAGTVRIEVVLASPPEHVLRAKLLDLLVAAPRLGPVKAARLLHSVGISESKTVAGLSERQRALLVELLTR